VAASAIWGSGPILFHLLAHVPPVELLAQRILWGAVFVGAFCAVTGRLARIAATLADARAVAPLALSAALVTVNWGTFIWAVQAGRALEAGIGYYVMPIVSVALGVAFLGERLTRPQWGAVALAVLAVATLRLGTGSAPWVPLTLATSFGLYGLIRKRVATGAIVGFQVETLLLLPFAIGWIAAVQVGGATGPSGRAGGLFGADAWTTALMIVSGLFTALPLVLFAEAARRLPYAATGMIQYLNPTLQVAAAVLILGEAVTPWHLAALPVIWAGLALYSADAVRRERAARRLSTASSGVSATPK
jgi:chloramphenicol-sensitive protein RarD